ncbi:fatty acid--CoA ligase family protein [Helicobacter sp. 13S00477-4]|uniref:ANL family adenylate-forming protein n=1 Tax=Helicobacter sp. 13S00477-4 TaxID=1905759 RepID=UPI000BA4E788|nr:fatty acid--CoA ligase family protein [Helicobacter sp. 13S00477-4]PAF51504.1 hypothetical protein BKH44_05520 [Helicobacter sp. 13S00477-4]
MQSVIKHPFFERLKNYQDSLAIIDKDKKYTYANLYESIKQSIYSLEIPDQSIVALISDYSFQSIAILLSLSIKKCIIAPLNPENPNHYLQDSPIEFIITKDKISKLQKNTHPFIQYLKEKQTSGLILFSSGSTGKPKGIVHNLDSMLDSYSQKIPNPTNTAGIFLLDHIAGIDVLFNQLAIGGTLTIPKKRTPSEVCKLIEKHNVEILPASPTFLKLLLLSGVLEEYDLSSLKMIIHGSEIMPEKILKNLKKSLPFVKFKQSFGTSETNAIKTKNSKTTEGFIKIDTSHTQYKIINNELWLKSKTQALGYLNASNNSFEDGWFKTGDIVETLIENNEEYIKIIGRIKEVINVGGEKVLPSEIEGVVLEIEGIVDCLVYGESNPITGQSIGLKVVLDSKILDCNDKIGLKKIIRKHCKKYLSNYKIPTKITVVEKLEMTQRFKKQLEI